MKMVKSLLLGTAAGLVAVAGAQAADLPVKAKPVEYVKICSVYVERAFIQLGGWTFGRPASFFDYLSGAFGYQQVFLGGGATSAGGRMLGAYTWSFGNGVSWTSSIEDPTTKRNFAWDASDPTATGLTVGAFPGPGTVGSTVTGYTTCGVSIFSNDSGTANSQLAGCSI